MIRTLLLSFVLAIRQVGPGVMTTLTVPLRHMRPFPSVLAKLGVAPVPTDLTPADSAAFATAITNAVMLVSALVGDGNECAGELAVNAAADHVSFDSAGQTISWTTADATARQILVLWFGDEFREHLTEPVSLTTGSPPIGSTRVAARVQ